MIMKYIIFPLAVLLAIAIVPAYAETYDVTINVNSHTNDCLPNCIEPEFLQLNPGDTVRWVNAEFCDEADEATWDACSRNYAFVSGNPVDGMDGQVPDAGTIRPGESKSITFNQEGQYNYYDPGHKWLQHTIAVGTVTIEKEVEVTKEVEVITEVPVEVEVVSENGTTTTVTEIEIIKETKIVTETEIQIVEVEPTFEQKPERPVINDSLLESLYPDRVSEIREMINVGLNVDADNVHTIHYIFHTAIGNNQISLNGNEASGNTLGFSFLEPVSGTIILKMSNALIGETLAVVSQDAEILPYTYESHGEFSIVEIELNDTRSITLAATYVTPEYLSIAILGAVIITVVGIGVYLTKRQPALVINA